MDLVAWKRLSSSYIYIHGTGRSRLDLIFKNRLDCMEMGPQLKVSSDRLEKPVIKPVTPRITRLD